MASLITFHGNAAFVKMLVAAETEFLVVGGLAVVFYKCRSPNGADDLDLLLNPSVENAERFINVLSSPNLKKLYNLELCCLPSAPQVAKAKFHLPLKVDCMLDIDLFSPPEDVIFGQLFSRSECAVLNGNIPVHIISRPDLVEMKRRAIRILSKDKKKHEDDLRCLEVV